MILNSEPCHLFYYYSRILYPSITCILGSFVLLSVQSVTLDVMKRKAVHSTEIYESIHFRICCSKRSSIPILKWYGYAILVAQN